MRIKKISIRIGQKIIGGFLILILIFSLNAGLSVLTLNECASIIDESSAVINPARDNLNELNLMVTKSKMYITNWVYLPSNIEDKEALKKLHETQYPLLKEKITSQMSLWKEKDQIAKMDSILTTFEELLKIEKGIMASLVSFENYEDAIIKFEASNTIDSDVLPKSAWLIKTIGEVLSDKKIQTQQAELNLIASFNALRMQTVGVGLVLILVGLIAAFFITRSIINPIAYIKRVIQQLGKGELPAEDNNKTFNGDEVGQMATAVDKLVTGLRATSSFAENIGKGNYNAELTPLSDNDVLGNSLINMRDNLQKVAEDDKKRNWATEGMAIFGEILRKNNDNIARLSDEIISNLVKYLKANQGGLYIINDENDQEPYLYLAACYAWDKKKYLEQKIYSGDGLAGQAWREKDAIYLTDIPDDYISIISGLGEANPTSILIMPLKINDEVYGIMEIASFEEFQVHEREFVERIAESIASTISTVKINERTQRLLEESTLMTEQMRTQEEEMRQNMEELQATQEEMQRAQLDAKIREDIFNNTQCILETDSRFTITYINALMQSHLNYSSADLIGTPLSKIFYQIDEFDQLSQTITQNTKWASTIYLKDKQGNKKLFKIAASPVENMNRNIEKFLLLMYDVSELELGTVIK